MKKKAISLLTALATLAGTYSAGAAAVFAAGVSDSDLSANVSQTDAVRQPEPNAIWQSRQKETLANNTASGKCGDNLTWSFNESTGVLTISGSGDMWEMYRAPWLSRYADAIKTITFSGKITSISSDAFANCTSFTKVSIPSSVTSIGKKAFYNCSSLTSITIPNSVTSIGEETFYSCSGLTSITIPSSVTSIGNSAFYNCSSLTGIVIPKSVTSIGEKAFHYCDSLATIKVDQNNSKYADIDGILFNRSVTELIKYPGAKTGRYYEVPDSVKRIAKYAFCDTAELDIYLYDSNLTIEGDESTFAIGNILYVPKNSAAQVYAEQYTIDFVIIDGKKIPKATLTRPKQSANVSELSRYKTSVKQGQSSNNIQNHNYYGNYTDTVKSYLQSNSDGTLSRIEYTDTKLVIETYSSDFQLKSTKTLALELPIFGGFYSGAKYNFIVCGHSNLNENNSVEVVRVIQYDKSWKRLGSKSFYGTENITIPFRSGTVSITEDSDGLYIHTSRQMYKASDGFNHQANITFCLSQESMDILPFKYGISYEIGYVSHSFNQFIRTDGNYIYMADHGDAYPRAIVLHRNGNFRLTDTSRLGVNVLNIQGAIGDNVTKATLGGLELSANYVITVGSSVTQDANYSSRSQKNIFMTFTPKDSFRSDDNALLWLTNYSEGANITMGNPYLLKANDNSFVILWEETDSSKNKTLKYVTMNGSGKFTSDIVSLKADCLTEGLSDCTPIISDNHIIWYTTGENTATKRWNPSKTAPAFYKIPVNLQATLSTVSIKSNPNKLTYNVGDTLDTSGLKLTAAYSDRTTKEITGGFTCTPTKLSTAGTQKITVTYGGKTASFHVTVKTPLKITAQPVNATAAKGAAASFKVAASGEGLTYQWQLSDDAGKTWRSSSVKTAAYSVTVSDKNNGRYLRCVITDKYGSKVTSNAVSIKMTSAAAASVKITAQPANAVVKKNAVATFKVTATGEGLKYQWQLSDDAGKTWRNSKATGANYAAAVTDANNGRCVRCIITDKYGSKVTSNAAVMKITTLKITTQPVNATRKKGEMVSFKVAATGEGLTYQWQLSDDQGKTWRNSKATGTNYAAALTDATNGRYVRCIVTDKFGNRVLSNAAIMKITKLQITSQPVSVTNKKGATASFKIKAIGSGLTYQWQLSDDAGKTWRNSKAIGANYAATLTDATNGRCVRCIVTDKFGNKETSNAASMKISGGIPLIKPSN